MFTTLRRLHDWAFARLTGRIEDKALEAGIPVQKVNPAYTSQTCHAYGHLSSRSSQAAFRCTNDECWVTEYQADINAVARRSLAGSEIASRSCDGDQHRRSPWRERCALKPHTSDSPRDRSACDSTTGHREQSRQSRQTTLRDFSSETSDDEVSLVGSPAI
jgi:hypothetical protein